MYKILIVEDDKTIREQVQENLKKKGFICELVTDFESVLEKFLELGPELVLMDINLPGNDGFFWCEKIRALSNVPLIFISARNADMDIVTAMNRGGDDYLIKPFSMEVLSAKINGVLRRTYSLKDEDSDVMICGELIFNKSNNIMQYKEQSQELTHNESGILSILIECEGKTVSRDKIMRKLWTSERFIDDNTLTVNMTRLRKKLEMIGCSNQIKTVRNEGYLFQR